MINDAADEAHARIDALPHIPDADKAGQLAHAQVLATLAVVTAIERMSYTLVELTNATAAMAAKAERTWQAPGGQQPSR